MNDRNLLRERDGHMLKNKIDDFVIDPCKKTACLVDDVYNQLKRTYTQCEFAEKYHGKDCKVRIVDSCFTHNDVIDARIVRDGIWAAIEFHGASVTYSWEAVHEVMTNGGVFEL